MKCIATLMVDLERSPLATRSRLAEDLSGTPILRRTVQRLLRAAKIDSVVLLTPPDQVDRVHDLVDELAPPHHGNEDKGKTLSPSPSIPESLNPLIPTSTQHPRVIVDPSRTAPAPFTDLIRAGRWWGLNGWRGGLGGLCAFDEDMNAAMLAAAARRHHADVVVVVPAAAALIDPAITDAMIDHLAQIAGSYHFTFAQSPPGMTPLVIQRTLLEQLAPTGEPIGLLLAFNPDRPFPDLTGKEPCFRLRAEIVEAQGRMICDTQRSIDRVNDLLATGGSDWDAAKIGTWLQMRSATHIESVPSEIEIELFAGNMDSNIPTRAQTAVKTRNQNPSIPDENTPIRPSPPSRRGPITMETIRQICDAIRGHDDTLIVLGGHGDPLDHPALGEVCSMLRANAAAIAVRTFARHGDESTDDALFETPVDVIEIVLDAATRETYRRVHGLDAFDDVLARIERWLARREKALKARPLIVPSFVKCTENIDEMESFYATWQRRLGMALITGHTGYAGRWKRLAVTPMAPPNRTPCRRTRSRMMILADGIVTTCDQDFEGIQSLGNSRDKGIAECWQSPQLIEVRNGKMNDMPLCPNCTEWHRP